MNPYHIAFIPGDGVGIEVAREAEKILLTVAEKHRLDIVITQLDWGCDYYLKHGRMLPADGLEQLKAFDAIFLGSVGDVTRVPDHVSVKLVLDIRKAFDQYVNLRPIRLYPGVETVIRTARPETVNMVVVRENTEGEYADIGGFLKAGMPDGLAIQTAVFTQKGCERVMAYAFRLAEERRRTGEGPGMVTSCTKSNALGYSMVFWDRVFRQVADRYPGIEARSALVDALSMWLIRNPENFDVIVTSNLFGDILTDLGAMLQGGLGMAAGGNINPERTYPSMFEPIHGSAPDIAGKGIVNPIASIEAIAMMLDHLNATAAATEVRRAVVTVLTAGDGKAADIGGNASTSAVGDALKKAIERSSD